MVVDAVVDDDGRSRLLGCWSRWRRHGGAVTTGATVSGAGAGGHDGPLLRRHQKPVALVFFPVRSALRWPGLDIADRVPDGCRR